MPRSKWGFCLCTDDRSGVRPTFVKFPTSSCQLFPSRHTIVRTDLLERHDVPRQQHNTTPGSQRIRMWLPLCLEGNVQLGVAWEPMSECCVKSGAVINAAYFKKWQWTEEGERRATSEDNQHTDTRFRNPTETDEAGPTGSRIWKMNCSQISDAGWKWALLCSNLSRDEKLKENISRGKQKKRRALWNKTNARHQSGKSSSENREVFPRRTKAALAVNHPGALSAGHAFGKVLLHCASSRVHVVLECVHKCLHHQTVSLWELPTECWSLMKCLKQIIIIRIKGKIGIGSWAKQKESLCDAK